MSKGNLTCICGGMFAGKTEEMIRRIKGAVFAREKIVVFTPSIDNRRGVGNIISHGNIDLHKTTGIVPLVLKVNATAEEFRELRIRLVDDEVDLVAIDEIQFFEKTIIDFVTELICSDVKVIVAGLDLTANGKPFGPIPELLALSEEPVKLRSICSCCHKAATRTFFRNGTLKQEIIVGGNDLFEPRCLKCWVEGQTSNQPSDS